MGKVTINGKQYEVNSEKNLLEICLALGINVPHFCFHSALGSVGACRLCAVKKYKDNSDTKGKLVMSCMEPAVDGTIITTDDPDSKKFRAAIIESLMLNHPHDCPVCDEGGECHLQDMTVMTGHNYRNYDFKKRTYTNQNLGPFIHHEMNRCIQCYRCVRFYRDYAGGKDLDVFSAHNHVYFGRYEEGTLESEFSGNLVEVCPTGVFTDKTLKRHFTRKWDLTNAPSICTHCSLGCNTIVSERYGSVRRIMSRYNGAVNGYFLCDRGRFGYEYVNSESRIKKAMIKSGKDGKLIEADNKVLQKALSTALTKNNKVIGIGSPRASLESNFALSELVGKDNFYSGVSDPDFELTKVALSFLQSGIVHSPSLKEIEKADAILILGEDLTNTAPMAALAVRQAARVIPIETGVKTGIPQWHDRAQRTIAQDNKSPLFIANPYRTKLDELAQSVFYTTPDKIAELGFSVASKLSDKAPQLKKTDDSMEKLGTEIASALKNARNPLIISGIHSGNLHLLQAAANVASALRESGKNASLSFILPEANSMGLAMMDGKPIGKALDRITGGEVDTVIILENDLYKRAEKEKIDRLLGKCRNVIVLDHTMNNTTDKADILMPVGTFAESAGTLVNNEGRAQRYYRVLAPDKSEKESWQVLHDLMMISGKNESLKWNSFDELDAIMTATIPVFALIPDHIPSADFRMLNEKIRRQNPRFSGRTSMSANINVSEPKPPDDPDSPLAFTMEGANETPPSSLVPFYWSAGWNSPQSMNFYLDEPNGSMKGGDPGVRLIETNEKATISYFEPDVKLQVSKTGEWLIIPVYQIFGSEEMSSKAQAVAERISDPFVLLNKKDLAGLGFSENDSVTIQVQDENIEVKIKTDEKIPQGIAGISVGLPGIPFLDLPKAGIFGKADVNGKQTKKTTL